MFNLLCWSLHHSVSWLQSISPRNSLYEMHLLCVQLLVMVHLAETGCAVSSRSTCYFISTKRHTSRKAILFLPSQYPEIRRTSCIGLRVTYDLHIRPRFFIIQMMSKTLLSAGGTLLATDTPGVFPPGELVETVASDISFFAAFVILTLLNPAINWSIIVSIRNQIWIWTL